MAKREVAGEGSSACPSAFAGPSEVVVVADDTDAGRLAAIDVDRAGRARPRRPGLADHLVEAAADAVAAAVDRSSAESPRRADIEATLAEGGYAVLVDGPEQALAVANAIAPEHLELHRAPTPTALVPARPPRRRGVLRPVGAGVGRRLPRRARATCCPPSARPASARRSPSPTSLKHVHVVTLDEAALGGSAPHVAALAEAEGLDAHADVGAHPRARSRRR